MQKVDLLRSFTARLHQMDPLHLKSHKEDEYECEALSILARFVESGFIAMHDKEDVLELASLAVDNTFKFWFGVETEIDSKMVASALLLKFWEAYPRVDGVAV